MNGSPPPKNERILVIDDDPAVRAGFKKIFQPADPGPAGLDAAGTNPFGKTTRPIQPAAFELDAAPSGEEGLAWAQAALAQGRPYALAFVAVRMSPGWNGIEIAARIGQADPNIQIVLCAAPADGSGEEISQRPGLGGRLLILKKPFTTVEVLQLARVLAEKWALAQNHRAHRDQLEAMVAARPRELPAAGKPPKSEMAGRAQTEEALRQAQKLEVADQLTDGIAHDFNNLLTVIQGYVEFLASEMHPTAGVTEALWEIDAATKRATKLTAQMLLFSRKKPLHPQAVNLHELVTQFGAMLGRLMGENIPIEIQTENLPLTVRADSVMIGMAVLNLALNVRDTLPQGRRLLIAASEIEITAEVRPALAPARPGRFACLRVETAGGGIGPEEMAAKTTGPFLNAKASGPGLPIAYGIVTQHEGWIEVENEPGRGLRFKIMLPLETPVAGAEAPPPPPPAPARKSGGNETILLVEDEKPVCRLARTLLQRQGYRVYEAGSGAEALSVWKARGPEIDLLLTDMIMPGGMTGRELVEKIRAERGDLKIIYTTGYSSDEFKQNLALQEGVNFLAKPYHPDKLVQTVRHCLDAPARPGPADGPA